MTATLRESHPFAGLPGNHFGAILCDPPWDFRTWSLKGRDRSPDKHYQTMRLADIAALDVRSLAQRDSVLFMWATGPFLPVAIELMKMWGFRYSAVAFTWVKMLRSLDGRQLRFLPAGDDDFHVGLGFTTRKNVEFCLLGRRGRAKRKARDVRELIVAPVREHSRKPEESYRRIERYADGPYLELFARETRPGWTCWGDQVGQFDRTRNPTLDTIAGTP